MIGFSSHRFLGQKPFMHDLLFAIDHLSESTNVRINESIRRTTLRHYWEWTFLFQKASRIDCESIFVTCFRAIYHSAGKMIMNSTYRVDYFVNSRKNHAMNSISMRQVVNPRFARLIRIARLIALRSFMVIKKPKSISHAAGITKDKSENPQRRSQMIRTKTK